MRNLVKQETEEHRKEQEAQMVQAQRDSENEEKKPKLLTLLMQSSSGSNLHKDNMSNMYLQTPKSSRNQPFLSPAEHAADEATKFGGFKVLDVNENIRNSLKMPPRSNSALMTPGNRKSQKQPSKYQRSRSSLNTSLTLDGVRAQRRSLEKKQNHVVNRLSQPKGTKIIKIKTKKNDVLENSFVIDQILDHFLDNLDGQQDAQTSRASRTHRPKHSKTNRNRPMTPGNTMFTSKYDPIPLDEFNLFPEDDRKTIFAKGLNYASIPSVKKQQKEKSKYALRKHIDLQEQ